MGILLRGVIYHIQDDLRIIRPFIRIVDPGEAIDLATYRLIVKPFDVALITSPQLSKSYSFPDSGLRKSMVESNSPALDNPRNSYR